MEAGVAVAARRSLMRAKPGPTAPSPTIAVAAAGPAPACVGTAKLFLEDTACCACTASVLSVLQDGEGRTVLTLDRTVFHPQGGGQPTDKGSIQTADGARFEVTMAKENRQTGVVTHAGQVVSGAFAVGDRVQLEADAAWREECAKLHSAGHALDVAMASLGLTALTPTKGYHFPDSPYVEYEGKLSEDQKQDLAARLTARLAELVAAGIVTEVRSVAKHEVASLCGGPCDLSHLPDGAAVRVVSVAGGWCPCGGTHVKSTADLGVVAVTKLRNRRGVLRVSYIMSTAS